MMTSLENSRSRRSYPSLQHISLSPLSTRFAVEDDSGDTDYFSARDDATSYSPSRVPITSYLSSTSVPGTPGLFSDPHSNLTKRKKNLGGRVPLSDTHLQDLSIHGPLHHHEHQGQHGLQSHHYQGPPTQAGSSSTRSRAARTLPDNEWLLRTGLALTSSAREEKGQSWLVKRESSTSLVSDARQEEDRVQIATRSRSAARRQRSGRSTPWALSRRPSASLPGSKHTSRLDLRMTAHDPNSFSENMFPRDQADVFPDFVDEEIRRRMATFASGPRDEHDHFPKSIVSSRRSSAFFPSRPLSHANYSGTGTEYEFDPEEFDELEMQRLTRERGFGLGSWVDKLVEWTLFSVEEDPSNPPPPPTAQIQREELLQMPVAAEDLTRDRDTDSDLSDTDAETDPASGDPALIEQPGDRGGWADMRWLLGVARNSVL